MSEDNNKSAKAESKPDPVSEIQRLDQELRDKNVPGDFAELARWLKRQEKLASVGAALTKAVAAGIGRDDPTDWLAVECVMALLEYLEHSPGISLPLVDKKKIERAHKALASVETRTTLVLTTQIEWAVEEGKKRGDWEAAATRLAHKYGKASAELAAMLSNHHDYDGSARTPRGKSTTPQIIRWLTGGGEAIQKLAATAARKARKAKAAS